MSTIHVCSKGHTFESALGTDGPVTDADCPVCSTQGLWAPAPTPGLGQPPAVEGLEIVRELGRGGMGVVYEARHRALERRCALKVIANAALAGPEQRARFRSEARLAAGLEHPNIVRVYEVGEQAGSPYLVLEYVEGGGLDRRIAGKPQPPTASAALVEVLARAVHFAHEHKVVHRDLKPANVLLTKEGAPKVADFGLAKKLDAPAAQATGKPVGTPPYMAPEQVTAKEVGPATDVYALGAILYELLTGRPPFLAATDYEVLMLVVGTEPVPPSRLGIKVPRDLETICLECLQKEPTRRYASALALADDLGRFLRGEPIHARPVGRLERAWKWARRRPVVAGLLAALVLVVLTGALGVTGSLVYALHGWREARDQRAWAEIERAAARDAEADALNQKATAEGRRKLAEERKKEADRERARADRELDQARRALLTNQLLRVAAVGPRDPDEGRALLYDTRACPLDLRDLAWRFDLRLCRRELATLTGHRGVVDAVAFSPDGKVLASAGSGQRGRKSAVRLWDVARRRPLDVLPGHDGAVRQLGFSHDGRTLVSVGTEGTAIGWDVEGRKERFTRSLQDSRQAAFTPDGRALAVRDKSGKVTLWDTSTGKEVGSIQGPPGGFSPFALSSDRKALALGRNGPWLGPGKGSPSEVILWDVAAGKERARLGPYHDSMRCLTFSPDGKVLAGSSGLPAPFYESEVKLWDVDTGKPGAPLQGRPVGSVTSLAFSPDGKALAAGSLGNIKAASQGEVKLWDTQTGQERLALKSRASITWGVAFAPDGHTLASAQADATVRLWDVSPGQERGTFEGHTQWVRCLACSPDGHTAASGSADSTIQLLDVPGRKVLAVLKGHKHRVLGVAFSPDGKLLASGSRDRTVKLWDVAQRSLRASFDFPSPVTCVAYAPDGKSLAVGTEGGALTLWDVEAGKARAVWKAHRERLQSVAFSPDGKLLASAAGELLQDRPLSGEVKLWDVATRKEVFPLRGLPGVAYSVAFSRDGRLLAAGGGKLGTPRDHGDVRVWDVREKKEIAYLHGHTSIVHAVLFSKDGRTVVSGGFDNLIKLWDLASGQERATLSGHTNGVQCLALSPDGDTLLSGSGDCTVKVWEAAPEREAGRFQAHATSVDAVRFSPDGRALASGGSDGAVKVWSSTTGQERAAFSDLGGPVTAVAWSADGKALAAGALAGKDRTTDRYVAGAVFLWDVASGRPLLSRTKLPSPVWSVAVQGEGRRVAWGERNGDVSLWERGTDRKRKLRGHRAGVAALAFSPDGKVLASGSAVLDSKTQRFRAGEIILWGVEDGKRQRTLSGHGGLVRDLAFSPDGKVLASGAKGTVMVWELKTGKGRALTGHTGPVSFVAFRDGGRSLLTAGADGTVRRWDVASGKQTALVRGPGLPGDEVAVAPDGRQAWGAADGTVNVWLPGHQEGRALQALTEPRGSLDFLHARGG